MRLLPWAVVLISILIIINMIIVGHLNQPTLQTQLLLHDNRLTTCTDASYRDMQPPMLAYLPCDPESIAALIITEDVYDANAGLVPLSYWDACGLLLL